MTKRFFAVLLLVELLQNYGSQYMVGVLDKETNEMTLRPATLINLKPYVKSFEDEDREKEKEMSYGEKYKELAMKFGANRIQKSIRGIDREIKIS